MKKFTAFYWRGNPQMKNGGYATSRTVEARTVKSAEKKARALAEKVIYGTMILLKVKEQEA